MMICTLVQNAFGQKELEGTSDEALLTLPGRLVGMM